MSQTITLDDVFFLLLTSKCSYADPFRDVTLFGVFTSPDGIVTEIPAQYVNTEWIIKYVPTSVGQWTFETICSQESDEDLHQVRGRFTVLPAHERKCFYIDDFGAYPNDKENSLSAIQAAITAATTYTEETGLYAEVTLSAGAEYRFSTDDGEDGNATIQIRSAKNITINGNGAKIVFTNTQHSGIAVLNSHNINLLNFSVDFDPLPFTQGHITAVNKSDNTIEYQIANEYLDLDDEVFLKARDCYGITRILDGGTYKYGPTAIIFSEKEKLDKRKWRCRVGGGFYSNQIEKVHVGDDFAYKAHNYSRVIGIEHSYNVRAEAIIIHSAPGLSFFPFASECVTIRNCHVRPTGYHRFVSTNADGIHARSNRGFLMIDGCSFEAMSDDGINIHSSAMAVREVIRLNTVLVSKHTFTVKEGDRLVVMDRTNGVVRAEVYVTAVEDFEYTQIIHFDRDVTGISAGMEFSSADNLYNLNSCGSSFVICNCHFKAHRCRDVLLSSQYGIVENNIFENEDGWGIALFHETAVWGEGPIARDVKIRNNTFYGRSQATQAAIFSYITVKDGITPAREIKNISITGNRFYDVGKVMHLNALSDGLIANNIVENKPGTQQRYGEYSSIVLDNCDKVQIKAYELVDYNNNLQSVYHITDTCGEAIVTENTDAMILEHAEIMQDERRIISVDKPSFQ